MDKLLLIEDEPPMGEMYQEQLSKAGFKVIWADNAEQGLELVGKEKPDLILLDLLLPVKSGIYFLRKLRQLPEKKISQTPVIVLSNYDDPETRKEAANLGIEGYLLKTDFTPKELVVEVERIYRK